MENNGYKIHNYHEQPPEAPDETEAGRSKFVTHEDEYGHQTTVTIIFMNDGSVRWEPPPTPEGLPPIPNERIFPITTGKWWQS